LEENKFIIHRDITWLVSKRGRSLCTDGRNYDSWKSQTAALLANEEILQRISIKTISISLHVEPFLKTLFQFKENVPRREKKAAALQLDDAEVTLPVSPGVEIPLAAVLSHLPGSGGGR